MHGKNGKGEKRHYDEKYLHYIVPLIVVIVTAGLSLVLYSYSQTSAEIRGLIPYVAICGSLLASMLYVVMRRGSESKSRLFDAKCELEEAKTGLEKMLEREEKARKEAEDIIEARDNFVSIISHEIRTPLNAIIGWARVVESDLGNEKLRKKAARRINDSARNQTQILDRLADFLQIKNESSPLETDSVKCSSLIESVVKEVEKKACQKGIRFSKDSNVNGQLICCDRAKISGALINLLQNAIKFTPEGGEVCFLANKEKDHLALKIKDSGSGIRPENLSKIFEKFTQGDSSTTRRYGGLGLGLALSNEIIKLHGGEIKVFSEGIDRGTEFDIRLPYKH